MLRNRLGVKEKNHAQTGNFITVLEQNVRKTLKYHFTFIKINTGLTDMMVSFSIYRIFKHLLHPFLFVSPFLSTCELCGVITEHIFFLSFLWYFPCKERHKNKIYVRMCIKSYNTRYFLLNLKIMRKWGICIRLGISHLLHKYSIKVCN